MWRFAEDRTRSGGIEGSRPLGFVRREDGSLTIFSLFIFVLILMMAGMAVDLMRHETERVTIQNTLDTAVLAAGSLNSGAATEAEMEAMVKDYVAKAGIDPDLVTVYPEITGVSSRSVGALADFKLDTIFMGMMGIDTLQGYAGGRAREGDEKVEIVLVLDVSGSMSQDGKIEALRPAAKKFVTEILTNIGPDRALISVVPYNHQVHLDDEVRGRIAWDNALRAVATPRTHPGAITAYNTLNPRTRCARFGDADFATTALAATGRVAGSAMFSGLAGRNATAYAQYGSSASWCSASYAPLYLYQNDELALHTFIDSLRGNGWTSIDYGMKWGVGILDEGFEPVVSDMADDGLLPALAKGHPYDIGEPDVKKIIVLMTDGMNTDHLDLDAAYKSGPTRIWHSATLAAGSEYRGYLVEMPGNPASQRWYVPGSPSTTSDDAYLADTALPADAVQWDYHRLYDRFRPEDVPGYFFRNDATARAAHQRAVIDAGGYGAADTRTRTICSQARGAGIDVYTIAFQAPAASETLLRDCAGEPGRYFDVDGLDISDAFDAIAVQLTKLRLTN